MRTRRVELTSRALARPSTVRSERPVLLMLSTSRYEFCSSALNSLEHHHTKPINPFAGHIYVEIES